MFTFCPNPSTGRDLTIVYLLQSLEQSFITKSMIEGMIMRWCEQGKPLFMASKEFKDRLLQNILLEVNLNLLKWTTVTSDIDIFEIMTMLILFSRCNLQEKLQLIFTLFCFDKNMVMCRSELKFMIGKISCAVAMTFQIKKSYVHSIAEELSEYILPENYDNFQSIDSDED